MDRTEMDKRLADGQSIYTESPEDNYVPNLVGDVMNFLFIKNNIGDVTK